MSKELDLDMISGSTHPINLKFLDGNDALENFSLADKAVFEIKESPESTATIFKRDTNSGNLTIDKPNSELVGTILLAESLAIPVGVYLGQCAIRFGDDDNWYFSDIFTVRVQPAVAERI